jgi:hypothetical protein
MLFTKVRGWGWEINVESCRIGNFEQGFCGYHTCNYQELEIAARYLNYQYLYPSQKTTTLCIVSFLDAIYL